MTTVARRIRADAQRNREQLLAAAVAAFSADSPEITLESIARNAGVGIGTLYRHFPSREALVDAAYRSELARLCDSVPGPAQRVQYVGQNRPVPGGERRDRIGGPGLSEAVGEIKFQDQRRGALLAQLGEPRGERRRRHAHQPKRACWRRTSAPAGRSGGTSGKVSRTLRREAL